MKQIAVTLSSVALLCACGGDKPADASTGDTSGKAAMMQARIDSMRHEMEDDTIYNARGAQELLDVYKAYAQAFPQDSLAPEYLFRAAGLALPLGRADESVVLYDRVIKDYPQWPKLVDTYYLKAMTVEELGKKADAKLAYEEVIKRYPDHQFAKDAAQMIDNMQYTPEELIEKWRMQNELEAKGRPADPAAQAAANKAEVEAKERAKGVR
ncbi:MAG: tetratricopeptide repeat protein [Flavobacteriales bacterium]|nr:MAG: tetratricopeptide repeat protein [Flavobacteriales bacterium]